MAEEINIEVYTDGLSRIDRVLDDSGYAFTALDINDKELVTLEPIKNYPHLLFVNLARNQISDPSPLAELPYLVALDLSENALTTAPVLPNEHLKALDVSGNQITSLQEFKSSALSSLKVNANALDSIAGLSGLPALSALEVSRNTITSLDALAGEDVPKLEYLHLNGNQLTSLDGIERLLSLRVLDVQENAIESLNSIEKLSALTVLEELNLTGNPVVDVENYRLSVILLAPTLTKLDEERVTDDERLAAVDYRQQKEAEAAAAAAEADIADA